MTNLLTLPKDIIRYIATFLSYHDVISFELTNTYLRNSLKTVWLNKIILDYPNQLKFRPDNLSKKTYRFFMRKSKIIELNDYPESSLEWDNMVNDLKKLSNLKRGDVIHWGKKYYRNSDKYFWNGFKLVSLDFVKDDYGTVPNEFYFPEFRPNYFTKSIVHNSYINFTKEKLKEMCDNFDPNTQKSFVTDRYNKYEISISYIRSYIKFSKILSSNILLSCSRNGILLEINTIENKQGITFPSEWVPFVIINSYIIIKYEWLDNMLKIN